MTAVEPGDLASVMAEDPDTSAVPSQMTTITGSNFYIIVVAVGGIGTNGNPNGGTWTFASSPPPPSPRVGGHVLSPATPSSSSPRHKRLSAHPANPALAPSGRG